MNKKLGVDLYFILFGVFGIFVIPAFFYVRLRRNQAKRQTIDQKYLTDKSVDLDERSLHFFPGDSKGLRKVIIDRERTKLKIRQLEKELYGY